MYCCRTVLVTIFRDCKGNEMDVGATPHPLRVLLELGLISMVESDFGRRGARNTDQTGNYGIKGKF
jgi:NAD/NADP transhydrogenase alpha subunit